MKKFVFEYGGFHSGYESWIYTISEETILVDLEHSIYLKPSYLPIYEQSTREEFIEDIVVYISESGSGTHQLRYYGWRVVEYDMGDIVEFIDDDENQMAV